MQRNSDLAGNVRGRLQIERRQRTATILERAVARGELPADVDVDLFNDAVGGLIYWRLIITRGKPDREYIGTLTRFVVAGLQTLKDWDAERNDGLAQEAVQEPSERSEYLLGPGMCPFPIK